MGRCSAPSQSAVFEDQLCQTLLLAMALRGAAFQRHQLNLCQRLREILVAVEREEETRRIAWDEMRRDLVRMLDGVNQHSVQIAARGWAHICTLLVLVWGIIFFSGSVGVWRLAPRPESIVAKHLRPLCG